MNRKSGIELLRILCMFGIVYMHTFGSMLETVHGGNMALAVFENALFNCGVSCFVLISGYFGIKKKTYKAGSDSDILFADRNHLYNGHGMGRYIKNRLDKSYFPGNHQTILVYDLLYCTDASGSVH